MITSAEELLIYVNNDLYLLILKLQHLCILMYIDIIRLCKAKVITAKFVKLL